MSDKLEVMILSQKLIDRFWKYVNISSEIDCWNWNSKKPDNYPSFRIKENMWGAHRVSWMIKNGFDPGEFHVLHTCDNKICVNPNHLVIGTHQDNMKDMLNKKRNNWKSFPGEKNLSSKLTDQQVIEIRDRIKNGEKNVRLAEEFDIHHQTISRIKLGKVWKHLNL